MEKLVYLITRKEAAKITGRSSINTSDYTLLGPVVSYKKKVGKTGKDTGYYAKSFNQLIELQRSGRKTTSNELAPEKGTLIPQFRLIAGTDDGKYPPHYLYNPVNHKVYKFHTGDSSDCDFWIDFNLNIFKEYPNIKDQSGPFLPIKEITDGSFYTADNKPVKTQKPATKAVPKEKTEKLIKKSSSSSDNLDDYLLNLCERIKLLAQIERGDETSINLNDTFKLTKNWQLIIDVSIMPRIE